MLNYNLLFGGTYGDEVVTAGVFLDLTFSFFLNFHRLKL